MSSFIYLFAVSLELIFLISFTVFWAYLIYSDIKGSPFVPSKNKEIEYIFKKLQLKRSQKFYDLGCGDGRVVRKAVQLYKVKGVGIDINPWLIYWSRLIARFQKIKNIEFVVGDITKIDYSDAQVVYLFLMPKLLRKLEVILSNRLSPKTIIVSHGFPVIGLKSRLIKTIHRKPFPSYFYQI